jgi:hypothetical protein
MSLNFQDVIRDVHNPATHSLQTSGGGATIYAVVNTGAATDSTLNIGFATVSVSNPTLYAVVNTGAATDPKAFIGLTTSVIGSAPTIYAVVNTSAAGVGNSIVTINPRTDYIGLVSVSGNVNVGLPTVTVGNQTIYAVVNTTAASGLETIFIGTPTLYAVVNTQATASSNITLDAGSKTQIVGNMTIQDGGNSITVDGSVGILGNMTLSDSKTFIGSVSVTGTVGLNAGVNGIGFSTVNVAEIKAGTNFIGLVSIEGNVRAWGNTAGDGSGTNKVLLTDTDGNLQVDIVNGVFLDTGTKFIGIVTVTNQQPLVASNVNIGSVSVLGGVINTNINAGVTNIGFATVNVSNATLYAVVNTAASGIGNSIVTINPRTDYFGLVSVSGNVAVSSLPALVASSAFVGLVTVANTVTVGAHALSAGIAGIGFATVSLGAGTSNIGDVDVASIAAGVNYVGLASVNIGGTLPALSVGTATIGIVQVANQPALVAGSAYVGLMSISGNVAVSALPATPVGTNFIGLATVVNGLAWPDPKTFIGLATTVNGTSTANIGSVSVLGGSIGLNASVNKIGFATINVAGMSALVASNVNIGSVSILGGGIGINAGVNNIGFATVTLSGAGNPSVFAVNVGTNKTLLNLPIGFSTASVVTVAVPATSASVKITNMLLNSDATVRFTIKSGVTYLTGNASIGITLNPGGGFIMTGSPDSPSWIGLPSGALVIEKFDLTGTSAKIAGNVVYFSE